MSTEIALIQKVQSFFTSQSGRDFVIFCSRWVIFLFGIPFVIIAWRNGKRPVGQKILRIALAGLFAFLIAFIVGHVFDRTRPFRASPEIQLLVPPPGTIYSFPSIHASIAFAFAFAILMLTKNGTRYLQIPGTVFRLTVFLMALFVAFGRVASGVHYPTDVAAGALVGLVSALASRYLPFATRVFRS